MILERFRLDGQVALITGGTRGIGLAIAQALGEAGARLVLSSMTPRPEAVEELRGQGFVVDYVQGDIGDPAVPAVLVAETIRLGGRIDILVNNAGIAAHGETETFAGETYRRLMDVNVDGVFRACQAALVPMRAQRSGVILNIGSISGVVSNIPQKQVAYNTSKGAVHMMTRSIASDVAGEGIRVNAIAPGYITTEMTNGGLPDPVWGPVWKQMTPMGRGGSPEDVGAAALYLCSPASAYVTGEVLMVDGGYTAR